MRDPGPRAAFLGASIGLLAVSHAVVFIRLADAHPLLIAAARMGVAALVLLPLAFALPAIRAEWRAADRRVWGLTLIAGVMLAGHFATWIASLDYTTIANSTALVTLNPIWIALFGVFLGAARPGPAAWGAIALAVSGAVAIALGSAGAGGEVARGRLAGDGLALIGGVFAAAYLMIGQAVRRHLSVLAYTAICYAMAACVLVALVPAAGVGVAGIGAASWAAMLALGLVSQIVGHTAYNWTLSVLSPGFVALCLLGEPVLGALFAILYFGEYPPPLTWAGGALILAGVALGLRVETRRLGA